jgi:hypothetical protein
VPKDLIIGSRDRPELYERLTREFAGQRNVEVVLDRPRPAGGGERPRAKAESASERRTRERRSKEEPAALATQGFVRVRVDE